MPYMDDENDSRTPEEKRMEIQNSVRKRSMDTQKKLDTLLSMIRKKPGFGPLERVITDSKKLISFHVQWQKLKVSSGKTQYLNRDTDKTQYEKPVPDAATYKINMVSVDNTKIFQQAGYVCNSLDHILSWLYNTSDYNELLKIVNKCKTLINLYVEWEERTDPKDKTKKLYYNRKLYTVQPGKPIPLFGQSNLGLKFMPRIDEGYEAGGINTDRCLQNNTTSDVQFLLRMAEVNDAEEVLHAMRLMLA